MGFSRQEYWSELQFLLPGDLYNLGVGSYIVGGFFTTKLLGKPSRPIGKPFPLHHRVLSSPRPAQLTSCGAMISGEHVALQNWQKHRAFCIERSSRAFGLTCDYTLGFPGGASGKEHACQCGSHERGRFPHWIGKIPCRRAQQAILVFLPGEFHRRRSLVGYIQSMGLQRVGPDWGDLVSMHAVVFRRNQLCPCIDLQPCYLPTLEPVVLPVGATEQWHKGLLSLGLGVQITSSQICLFCSVSPVTFFLGWLHLYMGPSPLSHAKDRGRDSCLVGNLFPIL